MVFRCIVFTVLDIFLEYRDIFTPSIFWNTAMIFSPRCTFIFRPSGKGHGPRRCQCAPGLKSCISVSGLIRCKFARFAVCGSQHLICKFWCLNYVRIRRKYFCKSLFAINSIGCSSTILKSVGYTNRRPLYISTKQQKFAIKYPRHAN